MNKINDRLLSWAADLDDKARAQAINTSRIVGLGGHVALMPDAHWGLGCTIGSVIPTVTTIMPAAVGVDIGCGVTAGAVTDAAGRRLSMDLLPDALDALVGEWTRRIPAGLGNWHADPRYADRWDRFVADHGMPTVEDPKARDRAPRQLGTLGSGNHFLELCADEDDGVWIMLHSGSRGAGNRLAMHHIDIAKGLMKRWMIDLRDPDLAYLAQGTDEFRAYVHDLTWAQAYAKVNREIMLGRALDGLSAVLGRDLTFDGDHIIDNHHNYAAREWHDGRELWITRKGAISARKGQLGVIPGSMGTGSYIVRGLGNPASYRSAAHGAGRKMSRGRARWSIPPEQLVIDMAAVRGWQRDAAKALVDEAPGAYRDLSTVMDAQVDLVEPVHHLTTLANYKGVERGRW
ncbi:MAG TPA: RtcB family protein [Euzebyales bacterium]